MAKRQQSNLLSLDTPDATGAARTMVRNTLPPGTSYTFEGQTYTGGHQADPARNRPAIPASPSIPREVAIRHAYHVQRTEAEAEGKSAAEIPSLRTVMQTDRSSLLSGGPGVMPELEVVSGPDPAKAAQEKMDAMRPPAEGSNSSAEAAEGNGTEGSAPSSAPANAPAPPSPENPDDGTRTAAAVASAPNAPDTPPASGEGSASGDGTEDEDEGAVGDGPAADDDALEAEFPHVGKLQANGVNTYGQLRQARDAEGGLAALKGIGDARAEAITEVLDKRA